MQKKTVKYLNKLGLSCAKLSAAEASYHFPQASSPFAASCCLSRKLG